MSEHRSETETKPYVLLRDYMPGAELTFGERLYRPGDPVMHGLYMLGDGDCLTVEQLNEYNPVFLTSRELVNAINEGLSRPIEFSDLRTKVADYEECERLLRECDVMVAELDEDQKPVGSPKYLCGEYEEKDWLVGQYDDKGDWEEERFSSLLPALKRLTGNQP